ncbi:MAG: flagellar basal body-associated FliL family protein [Pseudomonadota bacterium]
MAKEEENNEEEGGKKGGPNMIVIGVVGIVLLGAGIFLGPMVQGMMAGEEATAEAEGGEGEDAEAMAPAGQDAIYQGIHPPLLINFTDETGSARFLQISLEMMARDQMVIDAVETHQAVIRSNLILLYGDIKVSDVTSRQGKELMLQNALDEINNILTTQTGKGGIEAVYFTNLVVQ